MASTLKGENAFTKKLAMQLRKAHVLPSLCLRLKRARPPTPSMCACDFAPIETGRTRWWLSSAHRDQSGEFGGRMFLQFLAQLIEPRA